MRIFRAASLLTVCVAVSVILILLYSGLSIVTGLAETSEVRITYNSTRITVYGFRFENRGPLPFTVNVSGRISFGNFSLDLPTALTVVDPGESLSELVFDRPREVEVYKPTLGCRVWNLALFFECGFPPFVVARFNRSLSFPVEPSIVFRPRNIRVLGFNLTHVDLSAEIEFSYNGTLFEEDSRSVEVYVERGGRIFGRIYSPDRFTVKPYRIYVIPVKLKAPVENLKDTVLLVKVRSDLFEVEAELGLEGVRV